MRLIDADKFADRLLNAWDTADEQKRSDIVAIMADIVVPILAGTPTVDIKTEVKYGEWDLEVNSFYADNWDESIELVIYILATCSLCGQEHHKKQVFSKRLYAPEDADDDFRFDQEYEKAKALEEFRQENYKFNNYCSNCGAKMQIEQVTELKNKYTKE